MCTQVFHSVTQRLGRSPRFGDRSVGRGRLSLRSLLACGWVVACLMDAGLLLAQESLFRKPELSDSSNTGNAASSPRLGGTFQSKNFDQSSGSPVSAPPQAGQAKDPNAGFPSSSFQPIHRNALPITGRSAGHSRSGAASEANQSRVTDPGAVESSAWGGLANPRTGQGSGENPARQDEQFEEIVPEIFPQTARPRMNLDSFQDSTDGNVAGREVVVQRYPNGNPQIERQVIQDENGNYVNDGYWKVYSESGNQNVIASGNYRLGKMHGIWMRKHAKDSSPLFQTAPFNLFEGPFISFAMFQDNRLEGMWTIMDEGERKIFEMPYQDGQRNGTASWFYPSLNKMREVTFREGLIHGRLREWDEQKKLTRDEEFIEGRRLTRNVTYYRPQQAESETYFLDGQMKVVGADNWWEAQPARIHTEGKRVQHGPVNLWHDNGLPKMKGEYANGARVGKFTWWYPSGTKQSEGVYQQGKKNGRWTWWHPNGMKASDGLFEDDNPVDAWTWWDPQGQVIDRRTIGEADQEEELFSDPADPRRPKPGDAGFSNPFNWNEQGSTENPQRDGSQRDDLGRDDLGRDDLGRDDLGRDDLGRDDLRPSLPRFGEELEDIEAATSPKLPPISPDRASPGRSGGERQRNERQPDSRVDPTADPTADPFRIPLNLFEETSG